MFLSFHGEHLTQKQMIKQATQQLQFQNPANERDKWAYMCCECVCSCIKGHLRKWQQQDTVCATQAPCCLLQHHHLIHNAAHYTECTHTHTHEAYKSLFKGLGKYFRNAIQNPRPDKGETNFSPSN